MAKHTTRKTGIIGKHTTKARKTARAIKHGAGTRPFDAAQLQKELAR